MTHEQAPPRAGGHFRWTICGLLFFATTVNYMDRQVLALLKPTLKDALHWSETDYGTIIFWFQAAYAIGNVGAGRLMDVLGVRLGLAFSVAGWSLMAMLHALARSVIGFSTARFGLGLTEGGNFPGAIKAVGEWFPRRERALATGIFNSGSNIGALITPLLVAWINQNWGWKACFLAIGALGFIWLILWFLFYGPPQTHPRLGASERAYIMSDPPTLAAHVPWLGLLGHRQTWAFCAAMFLVAPVWWFYLYWIPGFFHDRYGLDLVHMGLPLVVIYQMASVGGIGGGWISGALLRRGWSVNAARKTALFICACCVVPVAASPLVGKWLAVGLVGLAAAAHQGFAANMYTMVSDTVRREAVSSVVGIGGMVGAMGGMMAAWTTGKILDLTHNNYQALFVTAAAAYLIALAIIHLLLPRLEPMSVKTD
ncbi:MAG: MFS transporter [Candidatus Sumerlaeia bacterium]